MVPWRREGTAHREMVPSSMGAGQCPLRKRTTLFILDRRNSIHFTPQVSEDLRRAPEMKSRKTLQFIGCRDMGKRQCQ